MTITTVGYDLSPKTFLGDLHLTPSCIKSSCIKLGDLHLTSSCIGILTVSGFALFLPFLQSKELSV